MKHTLVSVIKRPLGNWVLQKGSRQGTQVELGTSSARAVQDASISIINLQRAVSDKRLRWAFQEIKSREEGVDREYLPTRNCNQPASMTNTQSFR